MASSILSLPIPSSFTACSLMFFSSFNISVIDHTYKNTNLQFLNVGDYVNIEFDYLARFVLKDE